ncbi:MAG: 16S rRNA (uracil(1498)-N(3))-methyltransferase [Firmicutes bacterium]|nr:16S rRNA (uracil(1498)-N(3))-methyltransferase [Bacillota bacterium]
MQRYFASVHQGKATLLPSDIFHITNVMRMRPLDKVEIAADGRVYLAEVVSLSPFEVKILSPIAENHELPNKVTLLYALAKGDKTDWVIQKATELGVSEIIGLTSERTIVRLDEQDKIKKLERYAKIIKEAGEQSMRSVLPKMDRIIDFKQMGSFHYDYQFIAYEREAGKTDAFSKRDRGALCLIRHRLYP